MKKTVDSLPPVEPPGPCVPPEIPGVVLSILKLNDQLWHAGSNDERQQTLKQIRSFFKQNKDQHTNSLRELGYLTQSGQSVEVLDPLHAGDIDAQKGAVICEQRVQKNGDFVTSLEIFDPGAAKVEEFVATEHADRTITFKADNADVSSPQSAVSSPIRRAYLRQISLSGPAVIWHEDGPFWDRLAKQYFLR
jgi:hypothetical protein